MSLGNTKLVNSGIQNEESDLRVHVCPLAKSVYVYPTACGVDAINTGHYVTKPVFTGSIQTATGYIVPWKEIPGIICVELESETWDYISIREKASTSDKGKRAAQLVKGMIKNQRFPMGLLQIELNGVEIQDEEMQIKGADIIITVAKQVIVQVKCDFRGGGKRGANRCTGNLFLQIQECNPLRQY